MIVRALAFIVLFALPLPMAAQTAVTRANWLTHPAIREIRGLVASIDSHLGRLTARTDSADCGDGYISVVAHLFTDSAGVARKYILAGGSGDSAGEVTYYYDQRGTLRFSVAATNAVNGTSLEDRRYYDGKGVLLYHDKKLLAGPGYVGYGEDPVLDPTTDFAALCGPPGK
jgi:hypothetical protein